MRCGLPTAKEWEFPQTEMPENVTSFKGLSIRFSILNNLKLFSTVRYLDDEVLAFLNKIKPLFDNVHLAIFSTQSAPNAMQILLTQLLPILGTIRGIQCSNADIALFEKQFPGTLARAAKELDLFNPKPASIPACLNWLSASRDFHLLGPRFLRASAEATTIFAVVDAVQKA